MAEENNAKEDLSAENLDASYLSLIKDANRILDTLSKVWKYSLTILLVSLSAIGLVSIALFLLDTSREQFFVEGVIFLAIAAWVFARNTLGGRNRCCTEDIPYWKGVLASFVKPDDTLDSQKDGQSIIENLMKVVLATSDWIRMIRRDVFSVLFWPIVAIAIFLLSVYQVNVVEVRIIEIGFVVYIVALTLAIYYGVTVKFRSWQNKVARFKGHTASALESL